MSKRTLFGTDFAVSANERRWLLPCFHFVLIHSATHEHTKRVRSKRPLKEHIRAQDHQELHAIVLHVCTKHDKVK
jgi:hypothetical protein